MMLCLFVGTSWAQWSGYALSSVSSTAATTLTDGYYVIYNNGRGTFLNSEGALGQGKVTWPTTASATGLDALASNDDLTNAGGTKVKMAYVFYVNVEDAKLSLKTGYNDYVPALEGNTTFNYVADEAFWNYEIVDGGFVFMKSDKGVGLDCNGWSASDHTYSTAAGWYVDSGKNTSGNQSWTFYAVDVKDVTEYTVTYNFTYGGVTKFSETHPKIISGSDYPNYTTTLPYAVSADAKPVGTVTADATIEVPLTIDETKIPFTTSTLTDGEFSNGMTWYYLTMRGRDVSYDSSTNYALAQNVATKGQANYFSFVGNAIDGFSIYNFVAGADKVYWRADAADGGRVSFTETSKTDGNTWMVQANGQSGYVFKLKGTANGWMNDHQPEIAIWNNGAGATDGGSTFNFTQVPANELDLTVIYDVTYNFVYNEQIKFTQTAKVAAGSEYPAITVVTPWGMTIGEKPTGTVNASDAHDIAITKVEDFPYTTAADVNNITTWYYAQMHANSSYTKYLEDTGANNIEWADASVNVEEVDSHLWGFVGDVFGMKLVNKKTGKAVTSKSGSAVLGDAVNATGFVVTASDNTGREGNFCMKYPSSNTYLNAQGSAVASWDDNDNGSTFMLTEYVETPVEVSAADYATLYLGQATYIPEGVEVYAVTEVANGYVKMDLVEGVLPANTGVILKNAGTYTFKTAGATGSVEGNLLLGSVENTYVEGEAYVLGKDGEGAGFFAAKLNKNEAGEEGTTHFLNNANKAYLPVVSGASLVLRFNFGGTTAIESVVNGVDANAAIYDLSGRRVEKAVKGIYIQNGKKIIVK